MEPGWLIDESKPLSPADEDEARLGSSRYDQGGGKPPLAVLIHDVTVHDVKRWFGPGNVRLDALVVTVPGASADDSQYAPNTFTFPGVRDGDRLPIEEGLLLYQGRPRYFLDLAITASADTKGAPTLGDLLAEQADAIGDATGDIAALSLAAPQVAIVSAAASAAARIASTALRLLQMATGNTIGLYRTTWFENRDDYGIGRHPRDGLTYLKSDLEFWYEIFEDRPRTE